MSCERDRIGVGTAADPSRSLAEQVSVGGSAYVRNLAAAEAAVERGQFNLAKVLRAAAHAQWVQAMAAARLMAAGRDPAQVLDAILEETAAAPGSSSVDASLAAMLARSVVVLPAVVDIVRRARAGLETHPDVPESVVAQSIWGCHGCGLLVEGDRPAICTVCGALSPEFTWFGPFYSGTPEHLGQRSPAAIRAILAAVPDQVAHIVSGGEDGALGRPSSPEEWSVKELVAHLLETDRLFHARVRAILGHEGAGLPSVDTPVPPWKLHEGKDYAAMPMDATVARLRETRAATLALVDTLTTEQWARGGINRGGTVTVLDLGSWLANHDRGHLAQLRRLCGRQEVERPPL